MAATAFSISMILGAWGFQYIGGYPPCKLCYYQRYPHWAAGGFGLLALLFSGALLPYLAALSAAITGAIGVFHSGVERKLWEFSTLLSQKRLYYRSIHDRPKTKRKAKPEEPDDKPTGSSEDMDFG